jgi:4-hydroxymandelate oxidase
VITHVTISEQSDRRTVTADFEATARGLLPAYALAYFDAAAGSGVSSAEGVADWSAVRFRPHVLRDVSTIDTSTTVLGTPLRTPVMIAPMAQQQAAHADGEIAMARAAAATGSLVGVSTNVAVPFAAITAEKAPWWYQVYVSRDRSLTELLVGRAVAAGARALLLTVDMMALLPGTVNPRDWPDVPAKSRMTNLTPDELAAAGPDATEIDPSIGFEAIGWLRELSGLPVLIKGVVRGDDAVRCVDMGAAGIIVSTHGGRRLGPSISSARALSEVVAAVPKTEVYVDSGIRTAEHVAAALALGARGVFIGRPAIWALAADGATGVSQLLTAMTADLALVMKQLGVAQISDLTPDVIAGP